MKNTKFLFTSLFTVLVFASVISCKNASTSMEENTETATEVIETTPMVDTTIVVDTVEAVIKETSSGN